MERDRVSSLHRQISFLPNIASTNTTLTGRMAPSKNTVRPFDPSRRPLPSLLPSPAPMTTPLTIPLSSVIEGTRARNAKKYGNIEGLAQSIQSVGLIQPIVLARNTPNGTDTDTYTLVAGGRRYRALQSLGIKELHHGVTLRPGVPGFIYEDEVPVHARKEAELDENLHRLDMDWIDNCLLVADVHESKRSIVGHKWGQRQTAELLGSGYSKSNVNYALRVAKLLRSGDKDILQCSNMQDAVAVMVKRKEDEALAELQRRVTPQSTDLPVSPTSTSSFLDSFNLKGGDGNEGQTQPTSAVHPTPAENVPSVSAGIQTGPLQTSEPVKVPLSKMFFHGDFRDVMLQMKSSFDHIITDIPYGIDMDNLGKKSVQDVRDEHEVEANVEQMPEFLRLAYETVRPHGFCVFWYDLDHHEKLQAWATDIGWKVQRWPLLWAKTHTCRNQAAQYNTTKNFEVAMILRKDEHTVLRSPQTSSIWTGDGAAERRLYNNPFAKPFDLWKWIFEMVAFPGQSVLDPFCGEMSSCRAAANCGLVPYGIEINEKHYHRGLENMRKVYAVIHKSNVQFV